MATYGFDSLTPSFQPPTPPPTQSPGQGQSPMSTLTAGDQSQEMWTSPQQQQAEQNAGALQQVRQLELGIAQIGQVIQQMTPQYPSASEAAREAVEGLDKARQALTGFVVAVMSQVPSPQPAGPAYPGM